jgi:branched-chain amino acid transport system substrate-binding protein
VNKIFLILVALVLAFSIGLSGCTTPPPEEGPTEWELPVLLPLTGPIAGYGLWGQWSAQYAAEQINAAGGIKGIPVKLTFYDAPMDPSKAVIAATEAIAKDPLYIIGPLDPISMGAMVHLAVEEGVPLTGEIFPDVQAQYAPWITLERTAIWPTTVAGVGEWVKLHPEIQNIVLFMIPGLTDEPAMGAAPACAEFGLTLLDTIEVEAGTLDMSAAATRALALNPDGFLSQLHEDTHARLCKELFERGMTEGWRIASGGQANGANLYTIGEGFLEDTYIWDTGDITSDDPGWQAYVAAYKADHDGAPPVTWANWGFYEAVYAFKAAVERLNITGFPSKLAEERLAIRDLLFNAQGLPSVFGGTYNYAEGLKVLPLLFYQIRDNQTEVVSVIDESVLADYLERLEPG